MSSAIIENELEVSFLGQCMDGYLYWYFKVSDSHIISFIESGDDIGPSYDGEHSDDMPPSPPPLPGVTNKQQMHMI